MTLFAYSLPQEVVVRVWDLYLVHGVQVLFKVAVSVLKTGES